MPLTNKVSPTGGTKFSDFDETRPSLVSKGNYVFGWCYGKHQSRSGLEEPNQCLV